MSGTTPIGGTLRAAGTFPIVWGVDLQVADIAARDALDLTLMTPGQIVCVLDADGSGNPLNYQLRTTTPQATWVQATDFVLPRSGLLPAQTVIYISDTGTNAPWRGDVSNPLRSLAYALTLLPAFGNGRRYRFDCSALSLEDLGAGQLTIPTMIGDCTRDFASDPVYGFSPRGDIEIYSAPSTFALTVAAGASTVAVDAINSELTFTVAGAAWTTNQWANYLFIDGNKIPGSVISNTSNTITLRSATVTINPATTGWKLFLPATTIKTTATSAWRLNSARSIRNSLTFTGIKYDTTGNDISYGGDIGGFSMNSCISRGFFVAGARFFFVQGCTIGVANPTTCSVSVTCTQPDALMDFGGGTVFRGGSIQFLCAATILYQIHIEGLLGSIGTGGFALASTFTAQNVRVNGSQAGVAVFDFDGTMGHTITGVQVDNADTALYAERNAQVKITGPFRGSNNLNGISMKDGAIISIQASNPSVNVVINTSTGRDINVGTNPSRTFVDFYANSPVMVERDVQNDGSCLRVDGSTGVAPLTGLSFDYLVSDGAIVANTFVKASTATDDRTSQYLTTDDPFLINGVALDAAAGAGTTIRVARKCGQRVGVKSDGVGGGTITRGTTIMDVSATSNGRVTPGAGGAAVSAARTTVSNTAGALVYITF